MNALTAVQTLEVTRDTVFTNAGDALAYGLPLSLFGFATVFAVLILIWGILSLFKVFFYTIPNAKKNSSEVKKTAPKAEPKVEAAPVVVKTEPVVPSGNDNDIVAAIIAAIEAYRAGTGHTAPGGFRVVSFKKRI